MGVRGLQTFLKENRQSLCRSLVLGPEEANTRPVLPLVVDAWGIIYQLYLDALPWASGGEYRQFYRLVRRLVREWRAVGIEPVFVFDGASPPEKHITLLGRMQQGVETARLFYTTRPESRSSPSGQRGQSLLPPFTSQAFGTALASLGVETHYVPRGEADGECVVLAASIGGYILGKDTDFLILGSGAETKGYIPLDIVEWVEPAPSAESNGSGFTTVSGGKKARARFASRLLPRSPGATLILPTFTSAALARRLRLPINMLPLLASLVGNDYSAGMAAAGAGKVSDRIDRIARTLRETHARPRSHTADTAYELVARVVRKLHTGAHVDARGLAETVEAIVNATIQYVLPGPVCCEVYPFCGELDDRCAAQVSRVATPVEGESPKTGAAQAYAAAQKRGHLNLVTHAWLHPDRVYLWGVLENPSGPSARAGGIPTAARCAAYTIVDAALGMRWPAVSETELDAAKQDSEAAELLGELSIKSPDEGNEGDQGDAQDNEAEAAVAEEAEAAAAPRRVVTEYLRQGSSTRVGARELELPSPQDDGPLCLAPLDKRLAVYRDALGASPATSALPTPLQPVACALRMCVLSAAESDPAGLAGRWRRTELEAIARAAIGCMQGWGKDEDEDDGVSVKSSADGSAVDDNYPVLTNRNAELVSQFQAALLDTLMLAQALLLTPVQGGGGRRWATDTPHAARVCLGLGIALGAGWR
ncbi:hypothetical protein CspeluHIS016_0112660 [Cutaneotrichosporon spelunceum]|uniref:PIN domain-like protein n=1 Tax=Cutaneotrichosporon spelunceum TaxID=1672016 RepID=A0AAD3Y956_9TREE|nr:hypothetical protein CspeluHIS016_0112660 [Cutaneotrichosporon spelunceum]